MVKNKKAFVFPGQGSQSIGMMNNFANHKLVLSIFKQASEVLDYDLWKLVQLGPEEKLNQTQYTQPALLVSSFAMWQVWKEELKSAEALPDYLAGHSLGEYTALACAEAISLEQAVWLVSERGRLMQSAVANETCAMAAILGLNYQQVEAICNNQNKNKNKNKIVQVANINSGLQIVIAGHTDAVNKAIEEAKLSGAKRTVMLPVSVASHCKLMQPIIAEFEKCVEKIDWQVPNIPVIHNVDVKMHQTKESICQALVSQLCNPVRWVETIEYLANIAGVTQIIECGPGKVLTGLNKRINKTLELSNFNEAVI